MNKYFILLFLKENTIILPGFGALTAPNNNLEDIMFLPYLKTDDGKLVDFIVETEGIDPQDAQNTVAKFIREMETSLSKGDSFDIFNFGSFFKNDSGEIEFKSSMKGKNNEGQTSETAEIHDSPEVEIVEPQIVEVDSPQEENTVEETEVKVQAEIQQEEKRVESKNEKSVPNAVKKPIAKGKKKRKSPSLLWIIGIPILLGVMAATIIMLDPFGMKKGTQKDNITATTEDTLVQDNSVLTEEKTLDTLEKPNTVVPIVIEEKPKETKNKAASDIAPSSVGFYLIGGVYPSVTNAEKKVVRLEKEGIKGEILNEGANSIYVSLGNYSNSAEARIALKDFRDKGHKVWLYEKKK